MSSQAGAPGVPNTSVTTVQGITGGKPLPVALVEGGPVSFEVTGDFADLAAEASLASIEAAAGAPTASAWSGSGNGTIVGLLKALFGQLAGTLAVSGTFWQTTQPVSGTVTANVGTGTQPVSGTITANAGTGTLAVSAASLPLPTGAATAAKQPTLGTAGTPSANVLSIQGVASGTPLGVAQAGGTLADYSSAAPDVPIADLVLLTTVPATSTRASVTIQNQSAAMIQVVRDDGAATAGTISSILLAPGAGAGTAGGIWSSATCKGRVRVFGAAAAQVSAFQE